MKATLFLPLILSLGVCAFGREAPVKPKPEPAASDPASAGDAKAAKSGDPFLRDGAPTAPKQSPRVLSNIYGLVEYIEVPKELWLAYSMANPVGQDATALRAEVQKWITAGKAKPIELTCVPCKSGQRMVVESIIERRNPSAYAWKETPPLPTPVPTKFETRNTHFTFEWQAELGPDNRTLDVSLQSRLVRMAGSTFNTPMERKHAQPGDVGQPLIAHQAVTVTVASQPSQPVLLEVATPFDDNGKLRDEVRSLLFFRGAPVEMEPTEGMPEQMVEFSDGESLVKMTRMQLYALLSNMSGDPQTVRRRTAARKLREEGKIQYPVAFTFEIERLEVTLADLNVWFADKDLVAGTNGLRQAALDWVKNGRGREVDRRVGPVRSGQRVVWESLIAVRYPNEYGTGNLVGVPTSFEARNTGYSVELEPVLGPDGKIVDASLVPSDVRHCGNVVASRTLLDGQMVPEVEQPIFATMKITTSIFTAVGKYSLLGITTPANDNAEPDAQRRILTFITFRP